MKYTDHNTFYWLGNYLPIQKYLPGTVGLNPTKDTRTGPRHQATDSNPSCRLTEFRTQAET
jgi:hypothetical protein